MAFITLDNGRIIGDFSNPYIVAELNTSHFGNISIAKDMIYKAKECGCDCVKLQSWTAESLHSNSYYKSNKMAKRFYEKFSLSQYEILELLNFSKDISIDISSTPYSIKEAKFLSNQKNIPFIKIASMEINNYRYLEQLGKLGKPLILSTGMSSLDEISKAVSIIEKTNNKKIIILHCVSIYPLKEELTNLNNILGLRDKFPQYPIGFSDHTEGISVPTASIALGACLVEKHFTLNNEKIGLDNQMATEPKLMTQIVTNCREVYLSLGNKKRTISEEEINQRLKMRRSLISKKSMKKGQIITEDDILIKRPGDGIPPSEIKNILGRILNKDIEEEEKFSWDMINN
tara:strand:+ start:12369 stop:13403 length:1035 start_codon:yes stop_codon:yes gene_type:complete